MEKVKNKTKFANELSDWYRLNQRDLPFRKTNDPYKIYLSEMMLQQTQMDTVLPYYERFIDKYPTIVDLANANQEDVLKLWEGLGYYRRARYLHETAKIVKHDYNGVFPDAIEAIRKLKGVGRYTAGAIHSIAFKQPTPAVDGNVMRVMSRIMGYKKDIGNTKHMREIEHVLESIIIHENPSDFTQALMELGALVCQKTPKCEVCPVKAHCYAYKNNLTDQLPFKEKAKEKVNEHYTVFLYIKDNNEALLSLRPDQGLLANMLEFPQYESSNIDDAIKLFEKDYDLKVSSFKPFTKIKHVFTHKIWHLDVYEVSAQTNNDLTLTSLDSFNQAMSKAHLKIIDKLKK